MKLTELVTTGKVKLPTRQLIYGGDGVGKSTYAAGAPNPIFLDIEGGTGTLDVPRIDMTKSGYADVISVLRALYSEEHEYLTIVIDALDALERAIFADVCKEHKCQSIEDLPYGKGYVHAIGRWTSLLSALDKLRLDKGMAIILIGHAQVKIVSDPTVQSFSRWDLQLNVKAGNVIKQWVDLLGYAGYETVVSSTTGELGRKSIRAKSTGDRWLWTTEEPAFDAKNRYGIPDRLPLKYSDVAEFL